MVGSYYYYCVCSERLTNTYESFLTAKQCQVLKEKFHVYLTDNGRISMAGLTTKNVARFAEAVDYVVRNVQ